MATESPMRMVEGSGARKWPFSKDAATFASPLNNAAEDELGLLLKEHRFNRDQQNMVPNRSGSAPPSMEGSFAAFGNLMVQQNYSLSSSLAGLNSAIENCESEEQLRSDPAYFAYYCANVNLNPRLPPPIISRENRHLARQIGGFDNNWRLTSFDDSGNGSLHLSTHNEEPEDDKSPQQASNDWEESSSALMPGQSASSLSGCHKSLVDLIQEDFPRTPSPVYNQTRSSSHVTAEEPIDCDVQAVSLDELSIKISKLPESKSDPVDVGMVTHTQGANVCGLKSNDDPSGTPSPQVLKSIAMGCPPPHQKVEVINKGADAVDDELSGASGSDASRMGALNISGLLVKEDYSNEKEHQSFEKNVQQPQHYPQRGITYQVHGMQGQVVSQGVNLSQSGVEKVLHSHTNLSSIDTQPVLHPPGITPPLYATAAAYMTSGNPFYPNLHHPSGLYAPQYSMGGYALSSTYLPPFMTGYPSPSAISMHFDATSGQSFNSRPASVSMGESIPHMGDLQHLNKIYGQHGLMVQPSIVDPVHMQYFQHPVEDAYGASVQYGQVASAGVIGGQVDSFVSQKESSVAGYIGDRKFLPPSNGSLSNRTQRQGGITSSSYYGSPPSMGVMAQFPASPLGSPALPGSPATGTNPSGRRNDMRFHQVPVRNSGVYSGWQGQRGSDNFNDPKKHSFLEELKSSTARKIELSDIAGRIAEFSVDQHGSRFIQQKLEYCAVEDKASVFKEVLPHASKLMTDVFGNYVIQKFFEHGSPEQRKELADQLKGQMLPLSLQMYGCRVIQKALEVIELDQKTRLVHELDGHVLTCVRDQNGNHVIQKCIECIPTEKIGFIISSFQGQVATLSTHPYGCRVIQRVLEHCSDELQSQCIVDEILESSYVLAQDQYGNYVTQAMMKDQFANYVIQKILEISDDKQREVLLNRIRVHLHALKKYTYGKHIVARFEQLSGEESQDSEP
ncbi:pumilio homolog 5 isoform X2 [Cornus florida]|uniref:pumilio homolog 5 isoform X2 n=1 Tax=Cornus florida TaxID=4283 RepID=UPI00289FBF8F|nr:pumilio homolog 5 isoform X2 [Cornus florida]